MDTSAALLPPELLTYIIKLAHSLETAGRCHLVSKLWRALPWRSVEHLDVSALFNRGGTWPNVLEKPDLLPSSANVSHGQHWAELYAKTKAKASLTALHAAFSSLSDNKLSWYLTPGLRVLQLQGNSISKASLALLCRAAPNLWGINLFDCPNLKLTEELCQELAESPALGALMLPDLGPGWKKLSQSTSLFFLASQGRTAKEMFELGNYAASPVKALKDVAARFPLGVGVDFWKHNRPDGSLRRLLEASLGDPAIFTAVASLDADFSLGFVNSHSSLFRHLFSHFECSHQKSPQECCSERTDWLFEARSHDFVLPGTFDSAAYHRRFITPACLPLMHHAAKSSNVQFLLETYLQDEAQKKFLVQSRDYLGRTPIFYARDLTTVHYLMHYGADLQARDDEGTTALQYLAHSSSNSTPFILSLVRLAGDSIQLNAHILHHMCHSAPNAAFFAQLADHWANPNNDDLILEVLTCFSLLLRQNERGLGPMAKLLRSNPRTRAILIRHYVEPRERSRGLLPEVKQTSPLAPAVSHRCSSQVKLLLRLGHDPNEIDPKSGEAPLHLICRTGAPTRDGTQPSAPMPDDLRIFKHLVRHKANIHLRSQPPNPGDVSRSPLAVAAQYNCSMVLPLLDAGADRSEIVNLPVVFQATVSARKLWQLHAKSTDLRDMATPRDDLLVQKLLSVGGSWLYVCPTTCRTSLIVACEMSRLDLVKAFIKTALDIAVPLRVPSPLPSRNDDIPFPAVAPQFSDQLLKRLAAYVNLQEKSRRSAVHTTIAGLPKKASDFDFVVDAVGAILTLLAFCGADPKLTDIEGHTAWDVYTAREFNGLLPEDVEHWLGGNPASPKLLLRAQHYLST